MDSVTIDVSEKLPLVKVLTVPAFVDSWNIMVEVLDPLYPIGMSAKEMFSRRRVAGVKPPVKVFEANGKPANTALPVDVPLSARSM